MRRLDITEDSLCACSAVNCTLHFLPLAMHGLLSPMFMQIEDDIVLSATLNFG